MKRKLSKRFDAWKNWKRPGFQFFFVLFAVIVIVFTLWISGGLAYLIEWIVGDSVELPTLLIMLGLSLLVGWFLSFFISFFLLKPIANLQSAIKKVTDGDFSITLKEKNFFDEIENINHNFNIMVSELKANQNMQDEFVSNVSHEFKTPLSAIEGYATLLQDKTLTDEERDEYTQEIIQTTKAMSELVGNMLLLSKISNQVIDCKKDSVMIDEQIRKIVVLLEPKWTEKNIEFDVDLDELSIVSNSSLIANVWRNLIENAIKFSPHGGKITISLKRINDNAIFTIVDQGDGVKEEDKEHIFEKFYQADTSHRQEGNGLGLSIVKKIIDLLGGTISVDNVDGCGCCFTVSIPL